MVRKITRFRRKLKGFLKIFFLSFLLFLGVLGICLSVWALVKNQIHLRSPLGKATAEKNTYTLSAKAQEYCSEFHLNCTTITINPDNTMTITLDGNELVYFSLQKDLHGQFASLQLTIAHLTIEGKRFSRLDFRFDKPVLTY